MANNTIKAGKKTEKKTEKRPTAVLLMAYGSPENLDEVEPYYTHIRGGVRPDDGLIKNLKDRYAKVGGKTPLHEITRAQATHLQKTLDAKKGKGAFKVFIGMKHWHPFIKDIVADIRKGGYEEIIAIALAPHYSKISIGGYRKALDEALSGMQFTLVESWHTNRYLIDCIALQLQEALKESRKLMKDHHHVIFTAHSLPERILTWNDPYPDELLRTCRLVSAKLPDIGDWSFAFQSAGMTSEPWLGPDINDAVVGLNKKNIIVCPIGFVSDNLEIIYDLDIESIELAKNKGIGLSRTAMRNTHPLFIKALYGEVIKVLDK